MKEQELVKQVLGYLKLRGIMAWRCNSGAVAGTHQGKRRFVRFNSVRGVADVLGVLKGGRFLAVECKVRPNKPTADQAAFLAAARAQGGLALVVYSLDDLIAEIDRALA